MRLNLGAGDVVMEHWTSVDLQGADINIDLSAEVWPLKDMSAEKILASHILEHFDRKGGYSFLKNCYRVLMYRRMLHIAVPDADKFVTARITGDYSALDGYPWTSLDSAFGGDESESNINMRHRAIYNWEILSQMLYSVGFSQVYRRSVPAVFDTAKYSAISLYVDAVKL